VTWNRFAFLTVATALILATIVAIGSPYGSLMLLYNLFLLYVIQTRHELPDRVAIHFGPDLTAASWTSRRKFLILSPVLVGATSLLLAIVASGMSHAGIDFMSRHVAWFACWILCLFFAVHALTISANRSSPARLPRSFWGVLVAFQLGIVVWVMLIITHDRWGWPR
jgi:hypothetical protein